MSEETVTEETSESTAETTEETKQDFDKVRQQVQQELANRDKKFNASLDDRFASLEEKLQGIVASASTTKKQTDQAEDLLADLGDLSDGDLVEGKTVSKLATAIRSLEKQFKDGGKAKLADDDAKLLQELKAQNEGQRRWQQFNTAFDKRFPDLADRRDEFVDAAITEIEEDDDLDNSDIKGLVYSMAKAALDNGKSGKKPKKPTTGAKVTKATASSTQSGKKEGDGVERDRNGLPIGLWRGEDS